MGIFVLATGEAVSVDDRDLEWAEDFSWRRLLNRRDGRGSKTYVMNGEGRLIHRLLTNAPPHLQVDHIDGDGLNNRRQNLRLSTRSQNACNRGKQLNNTSGYKNVYWSKQAGKWLAAVKTNQRMQNLGLYETKEEAHSVVCKARRLLHGDFFHD